MPVENTGSTDVIKNITVSGLNTYISKINSQKTLLLGILGENNKEYKELASSEKLLKNIVRKISQITSEEMQKDLADCDFGKYTDQSELKNGRKKSIYKIVIRGITEWIKKTKNLTKAEKSLLDKINIERVLIKLKQQGRLTPAVEHILGVQEMLGLKFLGRQIVYTDSFRHFINSILKQHPGKYKFGMLDLDNFKNVNDIFGHNFGDIALKAFFQRLNTINPDGMRFRYGGEEVGIICQEEKLKTIQCENYFEIDLSDVDISDINAFNDSKDLIPENTKVFFNNIFDFQECIIFQDFDLEGSEENPNYLIKKGNEIIFGKKGSRTGDKKDGTDPQFTWKLERNILRLTFSGGFVNIDENSFSNPKNIGKTISEADKKLYSAKKMGRAQICSGEVLEQSTSD